ncbi:MAG TPA: hypothetical protein VGF86_02250 [Candidatus Tumulicola sp.]|jgi:hypothetical protein
MNRSTIFTAFAALAFAAGAFSASTTSAPADPVIYVDPALPGPVDNCQWFDDNLNDRSIGSLIRQTDLLYNRLALQPDQQVTITQTGATTAAGAQLVGFTLDRRGLCADAKAFHPQPEPSQSPQ